MTLGERMRDRITGFTGVVTGRAEYLGNTPDLRLTAETGQDDLKERWVAEERCVPAPNDQPPGFS